MNKAYTLTMAGQTFALDCPKVEQVGDATISPNTYNKWGEVSTLTISKGAEMPSVVNIYIVRFDAGAGCAVTFNGWSLKWVGGNAPTLTEGKTYEITIIDNLAMFVEG
jgi:hypothetical protein